MGRSKPKRTKVSYEEKIEILKLKADGMTQREIAKKVNRSPSIVNKILNDKTFTEYKDNVEQMKQGNIETIKEKKQEVVNNVLEYFENKQEQHQRVIDEGFDRLDIAGLFKKDTPFDTVRTVEKLLGINMKIRRLRLEEAKVKLQTKELELGVTRTININNDITEDDPDG